MANIMDYVDWRGDLTFKQAPFNDVDSLIFSEIAYIDLLGIVPLMGDADSISVEKAAKAFFKTHSEKQLKDDISFVREAPFLLKKIAKSPRFKDLLLYNYVDIVDEDMQMQFSAFHVKMSDDTTLVVFRGTDDTLVGWKEDFNMSFVTPVPSQLAALKYLNETIRMGSGKIRLCGHSKGGNLSVYAGVMCNQRIRKKIIEIYNNDGPGFGKDFVEDSRYAQMLPVIKTIVPYYSLVGMLLEQTPTYKVADSSNSGIMQHDPMSWKVLGNHFVEKKDVSKASKILQRSIGAWIDKLDVKKREEFVGALFAIIKACGANTLTDLRIDILSTTSSVLKSYVNMDKESRQMIRSILRMFSGEFDKVVKESR